MGRGRWGVMRILPVAEGHKNWRCVDIFALHQSMRLALNKTNGGL
jgi:hypothetical protein